MDTEEIEEKLRQLRPRGAPAELRGQVLGALPRSKRRPAFAVGTIAALWLLVGLSQWWGARTDGRFAEGRAPLNLAPPSKETPLLPDGDNSEPATP